MNTPESKDKREDDDVETEDPTTKQSQKPRPEQLRFPSRLHYVLTELEGSPQEDIISWQPDGLSFRIKCKDRLEKEVIQL